MTAAPIASSNNGPPANALKETEAYQDAPTIPPIAAIPPTIPNAASLTHFIEKPARLGFTVTTDCEQSTTKWR